MPITFRCQKCSAKLYATASGNVRLTGDGFLRGIKLFTDGLMWYKGDVPKWEYSLPFVKCPRCHTCQCVRDNPTSGFRTWPALFQCGSACRMATLEEIHRLINDSSVAVPPRVEAERRQWLLSAINDHFRWGDPPQDRGEFRAIFAETADRLVFLYRQLEKQGLIVALEDDPNYHTLICEGAVFFEAMREAGLFEHGLARLSRKIHLHPPATLEDLRWVECTRQAFETQTSGVHCYLSDYAIRVI